MDLASVRLGVVPYLNVLPLLEGLGAAIPEENWVRATPRELAGLMAARELDVSILPVFEALRTPGYRILPGCAIACDGPVRSVKLFSLKPVSEIRTVLLDRSSLTSVHLAQILLPSDPSDPLRFTVSERPLASADKVADLGVDAAVAIGDTALDWEGKYPFELDLGEAWKARTGLPFVFACWVARPGLEVSRSLVEALITARANGEREVYEIAKRVAGEDPGRVMNLVDYLSRAIRYRLGSAEKEAIHRYGEELLSHGFLASRPKVQFVEREEATTPLLKRHP
jgi:chorismate dehydratase